jgi:hypothetical protein
MGAAYSDGVMAGKKDFVVGVYAPEKAEAYDFKACYRQGYTHGWEGTRREYLHSDDWSRVEIARKRTGLQDKAA